jgi:hypothetical protein
MKHFKRKHLIQRKCGDCVYFDALHECCHQHKDERNTLLYKERSSWACIDHCDISDPSDLYELF